jgi:arylsulfatase A-like enzyme
LQIQAPSLVAFEEQSHTFENAYAPSAWTRASIGSILTGLPPFEHGAVSRRQLISEDAVLLSESLGKAGYATGAVVGNPNAGKSYGFDQGWDSFIEGFVRGPLPDIESLDDQALAWLETAPRPFFLFVLVVDPHHPYRPPERFDNHLAEPSRPEGFSDEYARYLGEVEYVDFGFGRLLEALRARDELDETVVVLTSDHGEEFGEHGQLGHGKTVFEEVVRVPLLIRAPGRLSAGARSDSPVQLVDIAPTLLEAAGVSVPTKLPGRSLFAEANGATPPRSLFTRIVLDRSSSAAVIEYPWKLIVDRKADATHLYNLASDRHEENNLADRREHEKRKQRMLTKLATRLQSADDMGKKAKRQRHESELPAATRESLEALGYLEPESKPSKDRK